MNLKQSDRQDAKEIARPRTVDSCRTLFVTHFQRRRRRRHRHRRWRHRQLLPKRRQRRCRRRTFIAFGSDADVVTSTAAVRRHTLFGLLCLCDSFFFPYFLPQKLFDGCLLLALCTVYAQALSSVCLAVALCFGLFFLLYVVVFFFFLTNEQTTAAANVCCCCYCWHWWQFAVNNSSEKKAVATTTCGAALPLSHTYECSTGTIK